MKVTKMEKEILLLAAKLLEDYYEEISNNGCTDASKEVMDLVHKVGVNEFKKIAAILYSDMDEEEFWFDTIIILEVLIHKLKEMANAIKPKLQRYPSFEMMELLSKNSPFTEAEIKFLKEEFVGKQYKHYNGNVYTVLYLTNTSTLSEKYPISVVYMGQNGNVWSRLLSDWFSSFTKVEYSEQI
jgi:hypothetical protein